MTTAPAAERASRGRTEAIPTRTPLLQGTAPSIGSLSTDCVTMTFGPEVRFGFSGCAFAQGILKSCLLFGEPSATSSRPPLLIVPIGLGLSISRPLNRKTAAQEAIAEIRAKSGLTNEEIAPLAGVSRRSLQAWIAGDKISARKDQRLQSFLNAILSIAAADDAAHSSLTTRQRLLARSPGNVRAYDLLAEGRYDAAVDLALGHRRSIPAPATPRAHDLYSQLSHIDDKVELPSGRLGRRFSGRLLKR